MSQSSYFVEHYWYVLFLELKTEEFGDFVSLKCNINPL